MPTEEPLRLRIMKAICAKLDEIDGLASPVMRGVVPLDFKDRTPVIAISEDFQRMSSPSEQPLTSHLGKPRKVRVAVNVVGVTAKGHDMATETDAATILLYRAIEKINEGRLNKEPGNLGARCPFGFREVSEVHMGAGTAQSSNASDLPLPHFVLPMVIEFAETF